MNTLSLRLVGAAAAVVMAMTASADASAPAGRYTYPTAGTVYDTKTKLTWQQTAPSTTYTWADAKTYCAGVGASLGGTGWRLPTVKELLTIVDYSQSIPSIDPTAFPATPANKFWSSSPRVGSSSYAGFVTFYSGEAYTQDVSTMSYVRCVR